MTLASEALLVGAAQRGSADAFAQLVDQNQQAVRAFLRRLSGNHADADDLAQEAFITAWARIGSFRRGETLRAWLCGIAYRKWLTQRRATGRRQAREAAAMEHEPSASTSSAESALDAATILATLPPEQRAAVVLCLAAEFSHAEAAAALGLPLGTVKSHVARGRAKLLELLGGRDEQS